MMKNCITNLSYFFALLIMANAGRCDLLQKSDFLNLLEQGFTAAIQEDAGLDEGEELDLNAVPGVEYYRNVKEKVSQDFDQGNIPEVDMTSRTAISIPEICRSVFLANGFNSSSFILDRPDFKGKVDFSYFSEKIALEIYWYIERAKKLETILPNTEEAEIIRQQVEQLKKDLNVFVQRAFPDISVEEYTFPYFVSLENGPTNVLTQSTKRPLSSEQLESVYNQWDEIASVEKAEEIDKEKMNDTRYKSTLIMKSISAYIKPFLKVIQKEYDSNLPEGFYLPDRSERLNNLKEQFTKDMNL